MPILKEIQRWSTDLAHWQQDAIARLYADRNLHAHDLDDLYALAKAEAGLPDPHNRKPKQLQPAQVAAPPNPSRHVQIIGIKNLAHVNALVSGGRLPIAATGLTVIYGENGTGKSGYSRIFKSACRARDQREPILPNANLDPNTVGSAEAVFEALVNGTPQDLIWRHGQSAPDPLTDVSIFDTHCARAYIDNQGDFAYAPDGLDILEGLVKTCNTLKARAKAEQEANTPSDAAFAALKVEQTQVSQMLRDIPGSTRPEQVEALALLSDAELQRLELLNQTLTEADPKQKAQALRQKIARINGLRERIGNAISPLAEENVLGLQSLVEEARTAKAAADLAATEFRETPGLLPGTGSDEWKALFEAARVFVETSHPHAEFPVLPEESACPLCQNPLGEDGSARLVRFDEFIKQSTERAAREARAAAAHKYQQIKAAVIDLQLQDGLAEEISDIDEVLGARCLGFQQCLSGRQASALRAAAGEIPWPEVTKLLEDPCAALAAETTKLEEQAKALEATADEKAKAALTAERLELDARLRLTAVKDAVLETMRKHDVCKKLQTCIDGMETRGISRKSTDLSNTIASQELADALNDELIKLKVHQLRVVMKPESPGGKTTFKLTLQVPGGGTPSAILSEGEQRAIAIASFMAELRLGRGRGGIVLDDPVSSLDHRRRWEVAERLATEALARQVIVFTHDIYFLCILEQKAQHLGATLTKNYIRKTAAGFGVHSHDLPFDVLGTKDRIGRLKQMLVDIRRAERDGDDDLHRQHTASCYRHLRIAWERAIEEVLFNGVVQRFGEGVSTLRLRQVVVTDDDYGRIDAGMTKSSKFEHDAAMAAGRLPIPAPDEVEQDIRALEEWRSTVTRRRDDVAKNR